MDAQWPIGHASHNSQTIRNMQGFFRTLLLSATHTIYEIHSLYYLSHVFTFYFTMRPSGMRSGTARNYASQSACKFIPVTRRIP